MQWRPICLAGLLLVAGIACGAEPSDLIVLTPPHPAAAHEAIWLEVTVGRLPRGSLLRVTTEGGQPVGTISPFGSGVGRRPEAYTLALPKAVAAAGPIRLRVSIQEPNGASRAPLPGEVLSVALDYVPVSN